MKNKLAVTALILCITTLLLAILSPEPFAAIRSFYSGPFRNLYVFGKYLSSALLIMIAGVGIVLSFRGGQMNLGGEGQVYSGAVAALAVGLFFPELPRGIGIPLLLLTAAAVGFLIASVSGWLKYRLSLHELISSFLISGALVYLCDYFISGPMRDETSYLITTPRIPETYHLSQILPPSPLHSGLFIALAAVVFFRFWLARSLSGYRLRMFGENPSFARFGGISSRNYHILPIGLSGALYGLVGGIALLGVHYRAIQGFTSGLGWNGIAAALIAGLHPSLTIYAALLIAFIETGISSAMAGAAATYDLGRIIQGAIMMLVTLKLFRDRDRGGLL